MVSEVANYIENNDFTPKHRLFATILTFKLEKWLSRT